MILDLIDDRGAYSILFLFLGSVWLIFWIKDKKKEKELEQERNNFQLGDKVDFKFKNHNGFYIIDINEHYKPMLRDIFIGFKDYASIIGIDLDFSIDESIKNKLAIKFIIKKTKDNNFVSEEYIKENLFQYITLYTNEKELKDFNNKYTIFGKEKKDITKEVFHKFDKFMKKVKFMKEYYSNDLKVIKNLSNSFSLINLTINMNGDFMSEKFNNNSNAFKEISGSFNENSIVNVNNIDYDSASSTIEEILNNLKIIKNSDDIENNKTTITVIEDTIEVTKQIQEEIIKPEQDKTLIQSLIQKGNIFSNILEKSTNGFEKIANNGTKLMGSFEKLADLVG